MAVFGAGTNDAVTVKRWAESVDAIVVSQTSYHKFTGGEGSGSLCESQSGLSKRPGDRVRTFLRAKPAGEAVPHGTSLEGNEDTVDFYEDDFTITQMRYGVRIPWENMDQQRVPFKLRSQARAQITDWATDRIDEIFFRHLCGDTLTANLAEPSLYNGGNTIQSYDSDHIVYGNVATTEAACETSTNYLTVANIRELVYKTKTLDVPMRPLKVAGSEMFVLFLSAKQLREFKDLNGADTWNELYVNALQGGFIKDNPLFTGAAGLMEGVLIVENTRVRPGIVSSAYSSNVDRAVFCGAQTAISGYGMYGGKWEDGRYQWIEKTFDYEEELGIGVKWLFGLKRSTYNSRAYGSILVPTYVPST